MDTMTDQESEKSHDLHQLWTWAHHEDALFDSRFEKFATVHAILIGAAALVLQRTTGATVFVYGVGIIGVLLAALWFVVLSRSRRLLASLEGEIAQREPLYRRHITRGGVSQTKLMAAVPIVIGTFWAFLLVAISQNWLG